MRFWHSTTWPAVLVKCQLNNTAIKFIFPFSCFAKCVKNNKSVESKHLLERVKRIQIKALKSHKERQTIRVEWEANCRVDFTTPSVYWVKMVPLCWPIWLMCSFWYHKEMQIIGVKLDASVICLSALGNMGENVSFCVLFLCRFQPPLSFV